MKATITEDFEALLNPDHPHYKTRYLVWYGGRGSGKSVSVAKGLLVRGMKNKELILCSREFQNSIADSVIKTLEEEINNLGMNDFYKVQANGIFGKNGTEFLFKGIRNNVQSIKSIPGITLVWLEEGQTISDKSYEVLIPTIREPGSQIIVTFNPTNLNDPTYQRFVAHQSPDVHAVKVNWDRNPWLPAPLKAEMEKLKAKDPEAYEHVYNGAIDTRRSGAVYARLIDQARIEKRITRVPYDPGAEVFTAWDLGFGDSTAIWWLQFVGRELRWLDYYENDGEMIGHYIEKVKSKPYRYAKHFLPHDGGHGNIRGPSATEQLRLAGLRNDVLDRDDVHYGIDLLRQTLAYSVFDADKCKDGVKALENYAYEWNDDKAIFSRLPKHDWTSHACDAARYAAIGAEQMKGGLLKKRPVSFALNGKMAI